MIYEHHNTVSFSQDISQDLKRVTEPFLWFITINLVNSHRTYSLKCNKSYEKEHMRVNGILFESFELIKPYIDASLPATDDAVRIRTIR